MKRLGCAILVALLFLTACSGGKGKELKHDNITNFADSIINSISEVKEMKLVSEGDTINYNIKSSTLDENMRNNVFTITSSFFYNNVEFFEGLAAFEKININIYDEKGKKLLHQYSSTKDNCKTTWQYKDKENNKEQEINLAE